MMEGSTPISVAIVRRGDSPPWMVEDPDAIRHGMIENMALIEGGTVQGNPSVMILARLDNGDWVAVETTWKLLRAVYGMFNASAVARGTEDGL